MSTNDEKPTGSDAEKGPGEPVNFQDLVLDLNFVPTWARKSSGDSDPAQHLSPRSREDRPDKRRSRDRRGDDNRGPRSDRNARSEMSNRPRGKTGEQAGGGRRDHDGRSQHRGGPHRSDRNERPQLPVEVSIIPDRDRLGAVVRQLHAVKRSFPLTYVAGLFLTKPEYHLYKIESKTGAGAEPIHFFQCRKTRAVFLRQEELMDYLIRTHLDSHFERVEQAIEPPTGNFVCVGQCRRSGIILGPPNYHGYSERLNEVHRTRFAHMTLDQYRNEIDMVKDPAIIEKWKEECRTQVRYRLRETPDAEANLTLSQAENQFNEKYAASYVLSGTKVIMPGTAVGLVRDERLLNTLRSAWMREERFPLSLMLALRPAFRRMRLHLFKAGRDETFVTSIPPKPMDAEHAIESIKNMVGLISDHPGINRKSIIDKLCPGKSPDDPEVAAKLEPLGWLTDKGHIIEFFNGTYAIPGHLRNPGAVPTEKPQEHHHSEPAAVNAAGSTAPEIELDAEAPVAVEQLETGLADATESGQDQVPSA